MWIRSQNRRTLSNGIISYVVTSENEIIQRNENNSNDNSGYINLAEYSTKEKALNALNKIEKWINDFSGTNIVNIPVFQMPLDNEV